MQMDPHCRLCLSIVMVSGVRDRRSYPAMARPCYRLFFFFFFRCFLHIFFFFQAEDGIRDLVRSRGLGDVYKRQQAQTAIAAAILRQLHFVVTHRQVWDPVVAAHGTRTCLLYTSDAADERSSVDLGGRRIIKKKTRDRTHEARAVI